MTEPRNRRVGAYAKLLTNYASDDAIIAAGERAELLFVRGLAFLSTSDSDGYITDAQLTRFVGAGLRDSERRAKTLVSVGLWERADGGYIVRNWTKYHDTAEEKGRKRKTDRERKRGNPNGIRTESAQIPNGAPTEAVAESLLCSYVSSKPTTQQNTTGHNRTSQERAATPPESPPSMFCPQHPNGTDEPCGPCGTAKLRYRAHIEQSLAADVAAKAERAAAIRDCERCNDQGWIEDESTGRPLARCSHERISA